MALNYFVLRVRSTLAVTMASVCVLLGACGPTFKYVPTSEVTNEAREPTCEFRVLTTIPSNPFDEVGILQADGSYRTSDVEEFKKIVAPDVCRAGGDAIISEINGLGYYMRGTVIRYRR